MILLLCALARADIAPSEVLGGGALAPWLGGRAQPAALASASMAAEVDVYPTFTRFRLVWTLRGAADSPGQLMGIPEKIDQGWFRPLQELAVTVDGRPAAPVYDRSWLCTPDYREGDAWEPFLVREETALCGEPQGGPLGQILDRNGRLIPNFWWIFPADLRAGSDTVIEVRYLQLAGEGVLIRQDPFLLGSREDPPPFVPWLRDRLVVGLWTGAQSGDPAPAAAGTVTARRRDLDGALWLPQSLSEGLRGAEDGVFRWTLGPDSPAVLLDVESPLVVPLGERAPYLDGDVSAQVRLQDYASRFAAMSDLEAEDWVALVELLQRAAADDSSPQAQRWARQALRELQAWAARGEEVVAGDSALIARFLQAPPARPGEPAALEGVPLFASRLQSAPDAVRFGLWRAARRVRWRGQVALGLGAALALAATGLVARTYRR